MILSLSRVFSLSSLYFLLILTSPGGCFLTLNTTYHSPPASHLQSPNSTLLSVPGSPTSTNHPPTTSTGKLPSSLTVGPSSSALPYTLSSASVSFTNITSATTSSISPTPTIDPATLQDIETIHERRLSSIVGALASPDGISSWLSSLGSDGKWPDSEVDYTTGCEARRANWPAQDHWQRILVMAGAWHGGLEGAEQYVKDQGIRDAISAAMDYWFSRDFSNVACQDSGGTAQCPCTNTDNSLWNTNWFSNIILIPDLVGQSCLLLDDTLTSSQAANCTHMTARSFGNFDRNINGVGFLTGANTLDVASIGIALALLTVNASVLADAYRRIHLELTINNAVKADGIRADGSFGKTAWRNIIQWKLRANDILGVEIEAGGTQFAASVASQNAFATLFDGNRWMIYRNGITGVLHWDYSALGRFISFPVIDSQATGSININLTQVGELGKQWSSSSLVSFAEGLSKGTNNTNAGNLQGNRMFYTNDYMVHRGHNYVSTVKMLSSRTQNTECVNTQNPLGFHLSDGAFHTYLRGDEYEDIAVAWDWNLIPGVTVDYGATPLSCDHTQFTGVEKFVGGASDDHIGLAAMRYTNPFTKSLHWQKAWFFLDDDVQHIMIANVSTSSGAPVYSVLDQCRHVSPILVDGAEGHSSNYSAFHSLWHGDVGYVFSEGEDILSVQAGKRTGSWATIGTSTQPPATVDLFAAWIEHKMINKPLSYTAFPGTDIATFEEKSKHLRLQSIQNDAHISAIFDEVHEVAMLVFWDIGGGSITFTPPVEVAPITISANGNIAMIYKLHTGEVVISDPSQTLNSVQIILSLGLGKKPLYWGRSHTKILTFALPSGGLAGSSITQKI